jgi:MFS family permease
VRTPLRSADGILGLLAAHGISTLGTSMSFLAIPWFVLVTTGSATATGLAVFAEMMPYVLVQALGGPLVDRYGPWRVSVHTDLVAALAMGVIPALHVLGGLSLPVLLGAVAVAGAFRGAGDVARRVLLPRVTQVSGMSLERASGLHDGTRRLAGLLGSPLAGVLIAIASAPVVVAVDAATFLVSAGLVAAIPKEGRGTDEEGDAEATGESYLSHLREGLAYLRRDRLLLGMAAMIVVTNLLDQAFAAVLLPVWVRQELGSPVALGTIGACFGVGAVAGNALMAWLGPRLPRRIPFAISFLICGAPRFVALAWLTELSPVLAVAILAGLGAGGINPALGAASYERVPARLQARVLGAVGALAWLGIPFGGLVGGGLMDAFGLRVALLACGAVYFLATMSPFVFPAWRQMERGAAPALDPEGGRCTATAISSS